MEICAAADIHYPRFGHKWAVALADGMCDSGADVIVLAGDISAGPDSRYHRFLELFAGFSGPKLFIPGNHDLWSDVDSPSTSSRYEASLQRIAEDNGFHYLPHNPIAVADVGFAGTVGWCDYSFRQLTPPVPDLRVTPMLPAREDLTTKLLPIDGRDNVPWEELTTEDYAAQALVWTTDGHRENLIWNDAIYVDWHAPDEVVAQELAAELREDARRIADEVRILVGVSHFVPFEEILDEPSDDVAYAYCRAYMGSSLLGDAFLSMPNLALVLCGHHHRRKVLQHGNMIVANCSVAEDDVGPLVITLPEDRPE